MSRTNNNKLRIGIVGAGAIVRDRHLPRVTFDPVMLQTFDITDLEGA
jgi:predicted dehydrogenase